MSEMTVVYNELASVEFGPVEIDLYIDELQSEIEKAAMSFNFNRYQNAFSELRAIDEKPAIILEMPERKLLNRADIADEIEELFEEMEEWLEAEAEFNYAIEWLNSEKQYRSGLRRANAIAKAMAK